MHVFTEKTVERVLVSGLEICVVKEKDGEGWVGSLGFTYTYSVFKIDIQQGPTAYITGNG